MAPRPDVYRIGPFEIRTRSREIYKFGARLKLRPQPFQVLTVLVERAGSVVTREELRQLLWPDETFVDFDRGLNTSINELRRALGDSAASPRFIETMPKLGYRLIASVETPVSESREIPAESSGQRETMGVQPAPAVEASSPIAVAYPRRFRRSVLVALLVVAAGAAGYWKWRRMAPQIAPYGSQAGLAVLPFENLTGDAGQEYLSDGLTEEMITQLGRTGSQPFRVIARTSVMHYKQSRERVEDIGRELGVQYVLEGSLRRQADRVRVTAQLIRVEGETHIWAREYDRQLSDLFTLETEIAREISDEILLALGGRTPARRANRAVSVPRASGAYDLYLEGLYFWNKRNSADIWRAIGYFQQAIDKDPDYAPPYAGMADCYALVGGYSSETRPEYMVKARAAALKALELDPNLPEGHTALAVIVQNYDHDWQTAGNEYRRAIELNPSYAMAHHWYAEHLGYLGRFDEAFRESERARQLDPLSLIIAADHGILLLYSRQYDRAIGACRAVLEMDPRFARAGVCAFEAYRAKGMFPEELAMLESAGSETPNAAIAPWLCSELAYLYAHTGSPERARGYLKTALENYRPETDAAALLPAYLGLEEKDRAFEWLEKAYAQHSTAMTALKVDPVYDTIRGDPRFQDLLRRVGLAP